MRHKNADLKKSLKRAVDAGFYPPEISVSDIIEDLDEKRRQARSAERQEVFKIIVGFFKCLTSPRRVEILSLLADRERCVCEIQSVLETSHSNISQHLKILENAGIIATKKRGQFTFVNLELDKLFAINKELKQLLLKEDT